MTRPSDIPAAPYARIGHTEMIQMNVCSWPATAREAQSEGGPVAANINVNWSIRISGGPRSAFMASRIPKTTSLESLRAPDVATARNAVIIDALLAMVISKSDTSVTPP